MNKSTEEAEAEIQELRNVVREFSDREVAPIAQKLHLTNEELPDTMIAKMQDMGIYGVSTSVEAGGLGMGAMGAAVVTEELSRAWMSAGYLPLYNWSLIRMLQLFGTATQKAKWLPGLISGSVQTAHAGTEPQAGSDAANIGTTATLSGSRYILSGSKLWCTHANRADVVTVMCRTSREKGHGSISMLLLEKDRGENFVPPKLTGNRINTIGARGVHSYALFFDDYVVPQENLLGGIEGLGFKQLMSAYEFARMHSAFASVGLAQAAYEAALEYSKTRVQFGKPICDFQTIRHKLAEMATRITAARQLGYLVARRIDSGVRSDVEAGMAKLFASEMVQYVCQEAVQIHGGMGFATESPVNRFWCDSGLASIGDGTSEIQREVIARGLLAAA